MRVTKKSSGRRSAQVKKKVSGGAASAGEGRSLEAQVRAIVQQFAPAHLQLVNSMRRTLRKRLPTAFELVYEYRSWFAISFSPSEKGYEGVLAIRGDADGVKLYFNNGKSLPDPEKLLRGSANARAIEVESASTLTRPAVAQLIEEAINRNRVPFARSGGGAVVIRSSSAKSSKRSRAS
jgi:hypothetical protein